MGSNIIADEITKNVHCGLRVEQQPVISSAYACQQRYSRMFVYIFHGAKYIVYLTRITKLIIWLNQNKTKLVNISFNILSLS